MSELLRSVMAECAEMARAGRRAGAFGGCVQGQLGAAMAVALAAMPLPKAAPVVPVLVHDHPCPSALDAVLPIVLPPQERRSAAGIAWPLPARRAA